MFASDYLVVLTRQVSLYHMCVRMYICIVQIRLQVYGLYTDMGSAIDYQHTCGVV